MVEATYEQTNGRVIIGAGMSEQFSVNIGLRQGTLSPLLFIVVMELISRKISMKDTSRKLLNADDLAIVAEDKEELNESLEEWKEAFKQHVLRVNLEKTEVLSIGAHREELNIIISHGSENERGSTTKNGICSPGDGKEKERKTTYEMARLHRERHVKGGVGGRGLEDGGPG